MRQFFKIMHGLMLLFMTTSLQATDKQNDVMLLQTNEYCITIVGHPAAIAAVELAPGGDYNGIYYLLHTMGIMPYEITINEIDDYVVIREKC
ncbi:MAG: hypothetical protein LBC49_04905 [Bacteroidales bacterium]|jgi:hypothetical protein|nr:hypothetical protein [Bacteroidales bacterium]